jgi:hypothetical protein
LILIDGVQSVLVFQRLDGFEPNMFIKTIVQLFSEPQGTAI